MQKTEYEKFMVSAMTVLITGVGMIIGPAIDQTDAKIYKGLVQQLTLLGERFVEPFGDEADDIHEA